MKMSALVTVGSISAVGSVIVIGYWYSWWDRIDRIKFYALYLL